MKIGIITVHFGINYGSALQTYALSNFLREYRWRNGSKTDQVEVINYIPQRYSAINRYFHLNRKMNGCRRAAYSVLCAPSVFLYNKLFNGFLRKYTPLGEEINTHAALREKCKDFDMLIAGSDQIWNSDFNGGFDSAYFLEFASEKCIRSSYAASCGKLSFSQEELRKMTNALKSFSGISVREQQAKDLFVHLGFEHTIHVLDPVFLLDKKRWEELTGTKRTVPEDYLLIYLLDGDTGKTIDEAVRIAGRLGLKTVLISFGHIWSRDNRVDYYLIRKSPCDFIALMLNSSFVITNSFHGVAFSVYFNKQFAAFRRKNYNSRLDSIADMFDLQSRFLDSSKECDIERLLDERIDYGIVNKLIEKYRRISVDYLESMVELADEKGL